MAQKKRKAAKTASKKKSGRKKVAPKAKVILNKNRKPKRKPVRKVRRAGEKKASSPKEIRSPEQSTLSGRTFRTGPGKRARGVGLGSAGQSGDVQGLSRRASVDSESVEELVEEGQFHEAEAVAGVEDALDPDQGEVRTREVPEDDVPEEYLEEDDK
jgi:hypothetical protein